MIKRYLLQYAVLSLIVFTLSYYEEGPFAISLVVSGDLIATDYFHPNSFQSSSNSQTFKQIIHTIN